MRFDDSIFMSSRVAHSREFDEQLQLENGTDHVVICASKSAHFGEDDWVGILSLNF
jgi:hypothetical protein